MSGQNDSSEVNAVDSEENKSREEKFHQPTFLKTVFPLPGNPDGTKHFFDHAFHFSVGNEGRYVYTTGADLRCSPLVPRIRIFDINLGKCYQYRIPELRLGIKVLHFYCVGLGRALVVGRNRTDETLVFRAAINHNKRTLNLLKVIGFFKKLNNEVMWSTSRTSPTGILVFACNKEQATVKEYDFDGNVSDLTVNLPANQFIFVGQPFYSDGKLHVFRSIESYHPIYGPMSVIDGTLGIIDLYTGLISFEATRLEENKFPSINTRMPNMVRLVHHQGTVYMIARAAAVTRLGCFNVKTRKWHALSIMECSHPPDLLNICMDVAMDGKLIMVLKGVDTNENREREIVIRWIKVCYTRRVVSSLEMIAFNKFMSAYPYLRRESPFYLNRFIGIPKHLVL